MSTYSLKEYSDNFSKKSGILWQYCRYELVLDANNAMTDFTVATYITHLFKIKEKITGKTGNNSKKNVEIMVPLRYLSNIWRTLQMYLINGEIYFDLISLKKCIIVPTNVANQGGTLSVTDTRFYVPVLTLSTQDNAKLLEQLKLGFKRTINWNTYQSKKINRKTKTIFRLLNLSMFLRSE